MTTTSIYRQGGEAISSGVLLFSGKPALFTISDRSDELSFECIVDTSTNIDPPQLSFEIQAETVAKFIFKGPFGPSPVCFLVDIGTVGGRALSVILKLSVIGAINELTYTFWAEG